MYRCSRCHIFWAEPGRSICAACREDEEQLARMVSTLVRDEDGPLE